MHSKSLLTVMLAAVVSTLGMVGTSTANISPTLSTVSGTDGTIANWYAEIQYGGNSLDTNKFELRVDGASFAQRTFNKVTTYEFELVWTPGTQMLQLFATGASTDGLSPSATLNHYLGQAYGPNDLYIIANAKEDQNVSLTNLTVWNGASSYSVNADNLSYSGESGNSQTYQIAGVGGSSFTKLTGNFSFNWGAGGSAGNNQFPSVRFEGANARIMTVAVPAPGAALLGFLGLGLVGWVKRRFA